jgi:hypothetical protein
MFTIETNIKDVRRAQELANKELNKKIEDFITERTEFLANRIIDNCPVVSGRLKRSVRCEPIKKGGNVVERDISVNCPYATKVHEAPRRRKPHDLGTEEGGQDRKFCERVFTYHKGTFKEALNKKMKECNAKIELVEKA